MIVGVVFLMISGNEVVKVSRTDMVIGEVHHQRQRQIEVGDELFGGTIGRLVANKYLVASGVVVEKILETVDLNIIFFAGHPNGRPGVEETDRVSWLLLPIFIWGLVSVFGWKNSSWKNIVFLWLVLSIMWAIRFERINNIALTGVVVWVWGVIGVGIYNLTRKIIK